MKKIKVLSFLLIIVLSLSLVGCGSDTNDENKLELKSYQQLENGEYTVLDVREQAWAFNGWIRYFVTVVLQDEDGVSRYYEYSVYDSDKDEKYLALARLVPNDRIAYENGNIIWLDNKYSLTHLFEGMTKEEWEELQKIMEEFFSSNKDTDMSELLKEHKEWYCDKCGSYNNPWPQNAKYCRNCGEKLN